MQRSGPADLTLSKDPKLVSARVFVASLPIDRVTKEDVTERFQRHGNVLGVAINPKGFGFVQFEDEDQARRAVREEAGAIFKGNRIDCNMAIERKRDGSGNGGALLPPDQKRQNFGNDQNYYGGPLDNQQQQQQQQQSVDAGGYPAAKRKEVGIDRPFDAAIIVTKKELKNYAELVERKLIELNLTVDLIFLIFEDCVQKAIDDMVRRGLLYIIVVKPEHEKHRSATVYILHGTPQEHRNMPLEDALVLVSRNFNNYLSGLRIGSEQPSMGFLLNLLADGKHLSIEELERIVKHLQDRRDRLAESQGIKQATAKTTTTTASAITPSVPPPTTVATNSPGLNVSRPPPNVIQNTNSTSSNASSDLQAKIMSILGNSAKGATSGTSSAPQGNSNIASLMQQLTGSGSTVPTNASIPGVVPKLSNLQSSIGTTSSVNTSTTSSSTSFDLKRALDSLMSNPGLIKSLQGSGGGMSSGMKGPPGISPDIPESYRSPQDMYRSPQGQPPGQGGLGMNPQGYGRPY